jgi:threonine aldolase
MIELRSDTFTQPTMAMRAAMACAVVGNDCYGEDPTAARLEEVAADLMGKQSACLMPTGTMANLAALLAHCPRGTKLIAGTDSDIVRHEAHGAAACGGVAYEPVRTQPDGTLALSELRDAFPEDPDNPEFTRAALICLENTHNRRGGLVLPFGHLTEVAEFAAGQGVPVHLDGARIFNAAVASGRTAAEIAQSADSVQFCLSKGLCAPVGSVVAGSSDFVAKIRRIRKQLGGGMNQVGVIAAAGLIALSDMVDRLADDHANARRLADGLAAIDGIETGQVDTNIVTFRLLDGHRTWQWFVTEAAERGVAVCGFGQGMIRAVVHADVTTSDIDNALSAMAAVMKKGRKPAAA